MYKEDLDGLPVTKIQIGSIIIFSWYWYRHKRVKIAYHISLASSVNTFFIVFFKTDIGREQSWKFKKTFDNLYTFISPESTYRR